MSGVGTSVAKLVSSSRFFFFFSVRSPVRVESLLQAVAATRRGMRTDGISSSSQARVKIRESDKSRVLAVTVLRHVVRLARPSRVSSIFRDVYPRASFAWFTKTTRVKSYAAEVIHERLVRTGIEKFDCQIARPKRI